MNEIDPKLAEPTEPGFYQYTGGAQKMLFLLQNEFNIDENKHELVWCTYFDNGMMGPCDWSYIEQALGAHGPLVKIEAPQRKLAEPRTQMILTLDPIQRRSGHTFFSQYDETHPGALIAGIWVSKQKHEDLGSPETITITIEPGDLLTKEN